MMKQPTLTLVITATFLIGFIPWYLYSSIEPSTVPDPHANNLPHESLPNERTSHSDLRNTNNASNASQTDAFNAQLAQELINQFGDQIKHLAVQANLIKVRDFVVEQYPEDGYSRFESIILLAFPEQRQSIMNILALMDQYTQWLAENYRMLNDLSPLEREGHLWEKRKALFGDAAEIIWSEEREILAQKQRKVQQEIHRLGLDTQLSTDEKLYQLTTALSEHFGDTAKNVVIPPSMIASVFFDFDSVQKSLEAMPSQERQEEINRVRQQLGYNEEQIAQAQKKDEIRNKRWEKGLAYMAERQDLVDRLEGDELEAALETLRVTHFEKEAHTIKKEEFSGFYRYARPRVYGRN